MNWILIPALWLLAFILVCAFTMGAKRAESEARRLDEQA
ncbi:hypothetical protein DFO67_108168 [Modicisalibacter xianhensis]|uniref:Uncharacterized protein n=1 Tax=Modicisalibacter xianhensis TaxID=442341 RepID=A0A4R8FRW7_9GAMM|nr:hypothetical protein DFO67_108168 [Halomonas xianhensis]